ALAAVFGTAPSWDFEGNASGQAMGHSVATADVNGDGRSDLIVAPYSGEVLVFFGSNAGPSLSPSQTLVSPNPGFGYRLAALGDWNGDGYADVAITGTCT